MTHPSQSDDDWAELARELERDNPVPRAEPEPLPPEFEVAADTASGDEDADAGGESPIESDLSPPDGEPESSEETPIPGKKRRRRRRRRRKGGAGQPAEAAEEAGEESEGSAEAIEEDAFEPEAAPVAVEEDAGYDEDETEESDESSEDAGGELLRDLIATWNVPSWDEIIGGLYRPDR